MTLAGLLLFVLGAILASFACATAERLGTGSIWKRERSKCNACGNTLGVPDLIPILSQLFLRGRCRSCSARIPTSYTLVELALGTTFLLLYVRLGLTLELLALLILSVVLTILVVYDLRHTIVPFKLSLLLVFLGGMSAYLQHPEASDLSVAFLTAGAIALFFFLLHIVSAGRWMGLGDTPVALALSLATGASAFTGLLFSFWIGALIGIGILVRVPKGSRMGIEVPFVPFLAVGYLLAFVTQWNLLAFT